MISIGPFGGISPKIEPHLLPDTAAQTAMNCVLSSGSIRALKAPGFIATPAKAGVLNTIYRYYDNLWFHWLENVHIVRCPLDTTENLVAWTGEGDYPRLSYASIATSGGTQYPTVSKRLGVPIPEDTVSVATSGTATEDDPIEVAYLVTYSCSYAGLDMEGAPSLPTTAISFNPGQSNTITFPTPPVGNYDFSAIYIYRSVGGTIKRIASLATSATQYVDAYEDGDFGVDLVTDSWYPPPDDLTGLISLPGGILAGISGKDICFSVPYQIHAWPPIWRKPVTDNPVALVAFGNSLLVLTDGRPEVGVGTSDPENLVLELLEMDQACIAPRAVVDMGYAACFPTPDGIYQVGSGSTANATQNLFEKDQFAPPLFAASHDDKYFGFHATGGFIFNPQTSEWSDHDIIATTAWTDYRTDKLYIVEASSGDIMEWEAGDNKTYTWKSKVFRTQPYSFAAGRIEGAATVTYDADGNQVFSAALEDATFRLPGGELSRTHEITLTGTAKIDRVILGTSMRDLV